jgi:Protein of unknown function (DUF2877)
VASALLARLLDGPSRSLHVVHRSRAAWQLADDTGRAVVCVITPGAVRLPHAAVVPSFPRGSSPISAGGGTLVWDGSRTPVARWFTPARPDLPTLYDRLDPAAVEALARRWPESIGSGDGLTPYRDDVVCGALVTLHAAGHPAAAALAAAVDKAPLERWTTALSAALLRHAAAGYCIDALARYLASIAVPHAADPDAAAGERREAHAALLAVGHSSGHGLAAGVATMLGYPARRRAAA